MTKTELQIATRYGRPDQQKNRWSIPRYAQQPRLQSGQKERRIRLARIWQARKAEKEGSHRLQSEDAAENQDFSQDRRQIPSLQSGEGRGSGRKEVVSRVAKNLYKVWASTAVVVTTVAKFLLLFVLFDRYHLTVELVRLIGRFPTEFPDSQ